MTNFKKLVAFGAITLSISSFATTLNCSWLESQDHAPGFYRPAKIVMDVKESQVVFKEDTFLFRHYSPCWMGSWDSCAFGFSYYDKTWQIDQQTVKSLEISTPGVMWDAELSISFDKELSSLKRGEITGASISGDDNDGVWFNDEAFVCQKI